MAENHNIHPLIVDHISTESSFNKDETKKHLTEFLRFVQAPTSDQPWLPIVAKHLHGGYQLLNISSHEELDEPIKSIMIVARSLSNMRSHMFQALKPESNSEEIHSEWFEYELPQEPDASRRPHPMYGRFENFPVYSMLLNYSTTKNFDNHLKKVQFQLVLAHYRFSRKGSSLIPPAKNGLKKSCRQIRGASSDKATSSEIEIIRTLNPPGLLSGDKSKMVRKGKNWKKSEDLIKLFHYLNGHMPYKASPTRTPTKKTKHTYQFYPGHYEQNMGLAILPPDHGEIQDLIIDKDPDQTKGKIIPDERPPSKKLNYSKRVDGLGDHFLTNFQEHVHAMNNQSLSLDEKSHSTSEIAVILAQVYNYLEKYAGDKVDLKSEELWIIQHSIILLVQVWFGSSYENVISSDIEGDLDESKDGPPLIFGMNSDGYYLRKKLPIPDQKNEYPEQITTCRETSNYVSLKDNFGISEYLNKLNDSVDGNILIGPFEVSGNDEFTEKNYRSFLKKLKNDIESNYAAEVTITPERLHNFLYETITRYGHDPTDALFLTSKSLTPSGTQIFYHTPSVKHLEGVYIDSINKRSKEISDEGYFKYSKITGLCQRSGSVGRSYCPKISSLKLNFKNLRDAIGNKEKTFSERHNLFVAYTALLIGYQSGIRAISNPAPSNQWINHNIDYLIISDKDGLAKSDKAGSYFNTRSAPITNELKKQINHWGSYQNRFYKKYKDKMDDSKSNSFKDNYLFFINTEEGLLETATPSTLEKHLKEFYDIPFNSHRKFLRTEMIERGISHETVDNFMSHGATGQMAWDTFSTYDPQDYINSIKAILESLAKEIELTALSFPFKKLPKDFF